MSKQSEQFDAAWQNLTDAVECAGAAQAMRSYLDIVSRFHQYSWRNVLMICSQCPDATRVASFQFWKQLGRYVRKGEKGIEIFVPVVQKQTQDDEDDEQETAFRPAIAFRSGYVFDISQTEGDPLPEPPKWWADGEAPTLLLNRLTAAIQQDGIEVIEIEEGELGTARGFSAGGVIAVLRTASPLGKASTLIHEWTHELQRRLTDRLPREREVAEVEAEATAYVVLRHFGLDAPENANYIALWQQEKKLLQTSLKRIRDFAAQIIARSEAV